MQKNLLNQDVANAVSKTRQLRPYQNQSIQNLRDGFKDGHVRQILVAPTGSGKCFQRGTMVLMADGTAKAVENVVIRDRVCAPNGDARNVLNLSNGIDEMYRITPIKGEPFVCNANHVLALELSPIEKNKPTEFANISITDYFEKNSTFKHRAKLYRSSGVDFGNQSELIIPPYILGLWLGDGTTKDASLTKCLDTKVAEMWIAWIKSVGLGVKYSQNLNNKATTIRASKLNRSHGGNIVLDKLRELGVFGNKHIPHHYLTASVDDRKQLLAGLIDTDGHISHGGCDFISKHELLAKQFAFLCRSIGLACYVSKQRKGIKKINFEADYWRCSVSGDLSILPMLDKHAPPRNQIKDVLVTGFEIEPIGQGEYFGFEVDGDNLFLLADFTVVHNSIIALEMIESAIAKGKKSLVLCERRVLVNQMSNHLDRAGISHGVMMASHWRTDRDALVQVASAQTVERMESLPRFDVVFVDEVHVFRASLKTMIDNNPNLRIIGLTATPFNPALGKYFTNVASVTTMEKLIDEKFLVPFRVFIATEIDTKGVKVVAGEWNKGELEKRGQLIVGDVVSDYVRIANDVYGYHPKSICFSSGIAHGADLAEKFKESGIYAVQISSDDDDEYKAEILKDFAKPDTEIKILISVAILSRGLDVPDVQHVILARPLKKSFSEHVQQVGRGARPYPSKEFATVQDNSGNWLRFQKDWNKLFHEGVKELPTGKEAELAPKEPSDKEKEASKCHSCGMVWGNTDTCQNCGAVRVKRSDVVNVAGVMTEVTAPIQKEKFSSEYKENFYQELLHYEQQKGYKKGWAGNQYKNRIGVFPRGLDATPRIPSLETMNYIKSRQIAYLKGMSKWGRK
jgi:superfamily II DNA or RNA helicase